ncbi:hypothetical protein SAMN02982985_05772 [Rugamonas rubra]|uniref:TniQ protein n=1 Tax=Rugamonas rubra TaxID=758825 RepID=A0A1I4URI5_9BURK|nr:hypothetical protein SAMN02982985_05772 [Rugamonas rubra]
MHERLRLCPTCSRQGHHFIIHQLRPFANCPLHGLPLSDHCRRCGGPLSYGLGSSIVFGPINPPACRTPQLPLSVGGQPVASVMSARSVEQIAHWLPFLRCRINLAVLYDVEGGIDTGRIAGFVRGGPMRAIMPPRFASDWLSPMARGCWSSSMQTRCLEMCFWTRANRLWKQCHGHSRRWYVSVTRGQAVEAAPNPKVLAFLYWRMTWQGCSNPYFCGAPMACPSMELRSGRQASARMTTTSASPCRRSRMPWPRRGRTGSIASICSAPRNWRGIPGAFEHLQARSSRFQWAMFPVTFTFSHNYLANTRKYLFLNPSFYGSRHFAKL